MDVATLGLKIKREEADQGAASLDRLAGSAFKAEGAARSLTNVFTRFAGVLGLGLGMKELLDNITQSQYAMAQLEAAVNSTGGAAGVTVTQLDELAASLQATTQFSDEAVKGADALLLTFTKIRGDQFVDATKAVVDLAARMGGDLQSAALQVGKALNDPAQGLTALTRSGVSFSAAQKEMIKDMFAAGHEAEAQRLILHELNKEFAGSAVNARDTLGGALTALKNDFGELLEATKQQTGGFQTFVEWIDKAVQGLIELKQAKLSLQIQDVEDEIADLTKRNRPGRDGEDRTPPLLRAYIDGLKLYHQELLEQEKTDFWKTMEERQQAAAKRVEAEWEEVRDSALAAWKAIGDVSVPTSALMSMAEVVKTNKNMLHDLMEEWGKVHGTAGWGTIAPNQSAAGIQSLFGKTPEQIKREGDALIESENSARDARIRNADELIVKFRDLSDTEQVMVRDMQRDFAHFFADIVANGTASFDDLFDSIRRGFAKLIGDLVAQDLMKKLIRQRAASGPSVPIDGADPYDAALVGGGGGSALSTVGMVGVLFTVGYTLKGMLESWLSAAEKARRAAQELEKQWQQTIQDASARVETQPGLERSLAENAARYSRLWEEAIRSHPVNFDHLKESAKAQQDAIDQVSRLRDKEEAQIREDFARGQHELQEDYQVRQLRAQGHDQEAEALAFDIQQRREYEQAVRSGADELTLSTLAETQRLEALKRSDDALRNVVKSLRDFSKQVAFETASPWDQLAMSKKDFDELAAKARGGDQAAALQLPEAARAYLDASRAYNASGAGFQQDAAYVQSIVDAIADQYESQISYQDKSLAIWQGMRDVMDRQLQLMEGGQANGTTGVAAFTGVQQAGFQAVVGELQQLRTAVTENTQQTRQGFQGLRLVR